MMTSEKPYLVRAYYDWIIDNRLTPYLLADVTYPEVSVPPGSVQEGKIILNISPQAIQYPRITLKEIEFSASFSGAISIIYIPMRAVLAIYAYENGRGVTFAVENTPLEGSSTTGGRSSGQKKPVFTLIE